MNINEDILQGILADNGIYASEQEAVFKAIEIKPVDCDGCDNNTSVIQCSSCRHNKNAVDNFKPKRNELDNLFVGAPVMVCGLGREAEFEQLTYNGRLKFYVNDEIIKLPTIGESPRNVWLAPWLEMPEELKNLNTIIRISKVDTMHYEDGFEVYNDGRWSDVEAVMIIEELEK